MDILLIALNAKYTHTNPAVRNLDRLLKRQGYQSSFCEYTINDSFSNLLGEIYRQSTDIYAFSCYIWNIELACRLACELKKLKPSVKIVFGGPEVSYTYKKYLEGGIVDAVFSGEAEEQIGAVVDYLLGRSSVIPDGLAIKDRSKVQYQTVENMALVSSAYQGNDTSDGRLIYVETSRGCPFQCAYCLSAATAGVRFRSNEDVFAELDDLAGKGVKLIKFTDRTFNISQDRTLFFFRQLSVRYPNTSFHFEIFAGFLTDEMISYLQTVPPGRFQFEIGIQSTNPVTLAAISRREDSLLSLQRMQALKNHGNIHLHADLIVGLPFDTTDGIKQSVDDVFDQCDHLQLGFLKLLSGAPIEITCARQNYVFCEYPPYEVEQCDGFTFDEIFNLKAIAQTLEIYVNSGYFSGSVAYIRSFYKSPYDFLKKLTEFHNPFEKLSHQKQYESLCQFGKTVDGVNKTRLRDVVRLDYFKKYRNAPSGVLQKEYLKSFLEAAKRFLSDTARLTAALSYLSEEDIRKIHKNTDIHSFDFGGGEGETILLFDYKYDKITDITKYVL